MKVFATVFLLVLVSEFLGQSGAALPDVGICKYREYISKFRVCQTAFIVNMRRDPNGLCSPKLATFRDCAVQTVKYCRPSVPESLIRSTVNSILTEERHCNDAGINDPFLHPQKHRVPCSSIYFQKAYSCYNETLVLWRTNKTDSRLCSVYSEAIKCEKALIDAHCWYTGVTKELIELNFDGYNPFCAPIQAPTVRVPVSQSPSPISRAALPNVGSCTYREYIQKVRFCTKAFFVNMRRDPNGKCSPKLAAFRHCMVENTKQCLSFVSESVLRRTVNSVVTEKTYCNNAGISDPDLHPQKGQVPCSSIYFQKAYGCFGDTLKLWRRNRADSKLCNVYSKAIKCEKTLIDAECHYTVVTKARMELNFDGYNPFCAPLHNAASLNQVQDTLMLILSLLPFVAAAQYSF